VITPTIPERAALLEQAKASVSRQTYPCVEHLVRVDTDRIGQGLIRNELARKAHGDWLVFLDDDDLLDEQFIELHMEHAIATGADVVYSICRLPPSYTGWEPRIAEFDAAELRRKNYIPITALVRRSAFEKSGGFRLPKAGDDWSLWLALLDTKARFEYLPVISWSYRVHGLLS
jgi:glycosyltransferase involved in cell wall biosynthesis